MAALSKDALGDLSGLKGTEYHLLYALWLLLRAGANRIFFYQGNDLLARPIAPPTMEESDDGLPVPLHADVANEDVWIQLKSTESPWSRSSFIPANTKDDNLLKNFLCNAVRSENEGRSWRVELGTQGFVKRKELEEFISQPTDFPELNNRLQEIIARAQTDLKTAGFSPSQFSDSNLLALSMTILSQLAKGTPMPRGRLLAEIELELAYACYDRDLAVQVSRALRGALLTDVSVLPITGRAYDLDWINQIAAFELKSRALFDEDPLSACNQANSQGEAHGWASKYFVPRRRLDIALEQFLLAPQTLFVLVGRSGSGKSWSVTDWSARVLHDRMRLLLPASTLNHNAELSAVVARAIRPYTSADASHEKLLRRFQAASRVKDRGPAVIIIDDLLVQSNQNALPSDLGSLVKECKNYGIKLVLTCQDHIWDHHQLWSEISFNELYVADVDAATPENPIPLKTDNADDDSANISATDRPKSRATYSFQLGDFTPEEMTAVLACRLPADRAERVGLLLSAPSFAALRNPYLLTRYLDLHGTDLGELNTSPPTVKINELLDSRSEQMLKNVAQALSLSASDLQPAFDSLIQSLWDLRNDGLSYPESLKRVSPYLQGQSGNFIAELREKGFLTPGSPIAIVEEPIAERLFAKRLPEQSGELFQISEALRPEKDAGVAAALMRRGDIDPVKLAEALLSYDKRWIKGVSDGLAQCDPRDYRILGFLTALMHSDPEKVFIVEAANALGQLAARDKRAFKFVAAMYFGTTATERHGAEYALGAAMEFEPQTTAAAIRLKLSCAARVTGVFPSDRKKKRERLLNGALEPLSLIKNSTSAEIGLQLLRRYDYLAGKGEHDLDFKFLEDIDRVRGRVALYDNKRFEELVSELESNDRLIRYRAACAIRGPAIEQPLRIQEALCLALSREDEYAPTINRILLAAYPLVGTSPGTLFKALAESPLTTWDEAKLSTGQVLGHLGDLTSKFPVEVFKLLPKRLDAYAPEDRALLSEMFSYAWWRCAEHVKDAATHLADLATPDLTSVPENLVPFALRGAAIAQLGLICIEQGEAKELAGEQFFYPLGDLYFTYLNTREFMRRHARAILLHANYEKLRDLLLETVRAGEPVNINPLQQPLVQTVFRCTVTSLEMLSSFANAMPDPMPLITAIPRDWRALHMASQLLESGRRDQSLIDFTTAVCEEVTHGTSTFQALAEREKCLAQLAALKPDHYAALEEHRLIVDDNFFQITGKMRGLAQLINANPKDTLSLLDQGIRDSTDQATLYYLKDETLYWPALLLARVYARMFDHRVVTSSEAKELCAQVLAAVSDLPASRHRDDYLNIYGTIQSWLNGVTDLPKPLPDGDRSTLQDSHALAISILIMARDVRSRGETEIGLDDVLSDRRGWTEGEFVIEDDSISRSSWNYLNYVFPAVRLALVAVGQIFKVEDPAGRLLSERKSTNDLLSSSVHISPATKR